jgi:hypothetical protein
MVNIVELVLHAVHHCGAKETRDNQSIHIAEMLDVQSYLDKKHQLRFTLTDLRSIAKNNGAELISFDRVYLYDWV